MIRDGVAVAIAGTPRTEADGRSASKPHFLASLAAVTRHLRD